MPCRSSFQAPTIKIQIITWRSPVTWRSLEEICYIVYSVEDRSLVGDDGEEYTNSIIELVAVDGSGKRRAWLPSVIRKKLKDQMVVGKTTYIVPAIRPEQCLIDCI